jgi:hypothetical protein
MSVVSSEVLKRMSENKTLGYYDLKQNKTCIDRKWCKLVDREMYEYIELIMLDNGPIIPEPNIYESAINN